MGFALLAVKIDQKMPAQIADFLTDLDSHLLEIEELEHWPVHKPTHQAKMRKEAMNNANVILQHLAR